MTTLQMCSRARHRRYRMVAMVAAALVVSGCAASPMEPQPQPETDVPMVSAVQMDRIVQELHASLTDPKAKSDPAVLGLRLDGAALAARVTGNVLAGAIQGRAVPEPLGPNRAVDVVPQGQGYPRFFISLLRADDNAPARLTVLRQESAKGQFKAVADAPMQAGATFPSVVKPEVGVASIAPDSADGLMMSPLDALNGYAEILTKGKDSPRNEQFNPDGIRPLILEGQDKERAAVTQPAAQCPQGCLTYTVTHVASADQTWAVKTADNGAVVVGVLKATEGYAVSVAGSKIKLSPEMAALTKKPLAETSAEGVYYEVVALKVPPGGTADKVTTIAGSRYFAAAQAS